MADDAATTAGQVSDADDAADQADSAEAKTATSTGESRTFAGYQIIRRLGSGGMGEVYLAQHPRLARQDALKILFKSLTVDDEFEQRFKREADVAASLWHEHIVGVHDRGEYEGQLWISMDYVDGPDAATLLRKDFPSGMPVDAVLEITDAVAEALDFSHQRKLLHRDVKPANILLSGTDREKRRILLADFGIARRIDEEVGGLTATNVAVGTVRYAAPEQLSGEPIDGRTDQYALAVTAFELLTGGPMFVDENPAVVIGKHLSAAPPAPLDPVLATALAKDPADRFENCSAFAAALREHALTMAQVAVPSLDEAPTLAAVVADDTEAAVISPDQAPTAVRVEGAADGDSDEAKSDEESELAAVKPRMSNVRLALIAGLVTVLALSGLIGWLGYRAYHAHALQEQRSVFLAVGRQGALNLTTIDFEHVDDDVKRILDSATGPFYDQFQQRAQPFAEVVKQVKSKSVGNVTEAGLESASATEAKVLVAVTVNTAIAGQPQQAPRAWRMRISVQKVGDGDAKVSSVEFVQ